LRNNKKKSVWFYSNFLLLSNYPRRKSPGIKTHATTCGVGGRRINYENEIVCPLGFPILVSESNVSESII
jgi:hypothetical protein